MTPVPASSLAAESARPALGPLRPIVALVALVALPSCPPTRGPAADRLGSFAVTVTGVFVRQGGARHPARVVRACAERWGGEAAVPPAERGTPACRYAISLGPVEVDFTARALSPSGAPLDDFAGRVSFRTVPGTALGPPEARTAVAAGGVITATARASNQYGLVRLWVEDAPPAGPAGDDGGSGDDAGLPSEPQRYTYASGASAPIAFDEPTLQTLQVVDGFDNRTSPLVGEYVSVGVDPASGSALTQSCDADPRRDGKPVTMVISGVDPSGFFVSDLTACRLPEWTRDSAGASGQVRVLEPPEACVLPGDEDALPPEDRPRFDGGEPPGGGRCAISELPCTSPAQCRRYLPGHFGQLFVYNYSYPDGLGQGDLLYGLAGGVQEFTSTTQLTFPSWTIGESVRTLPPESWDKWLRSVSVVELGARICGSDNARTPFLTDQLCGHVRRNLKMESLESALVAVRRVRFPETFARCDFDADGETPSVCEQRVDNRWVWGSCSFDTQESEGDRRERECVQACLFGTGPSAERRCADASTFLAYGQFPVEMAPPGPARFGLDESLPARIQRLTLAPTTRPDGGPGGGEDGGSPAEPSSGWPTGALLNVVCDVPARLRTSSAPPAEPTSERLLEPGVSARVRLGADEDGIFLSAVEAPGACWISVDGRMLINLVTKDALPSLQPDCREDDADAERSGDCRAMHAATFDVVGHLRHVQAARPRWLVLPRGPEDVCCHPGPGHPCPRGVRTCP